MELNISEQNSPQESKESQESQIKSGYISKKIHNKKNKTLEFTLTNINVSIANAIRKTDHTYADINIFFFPLSFIGVSGLTFVVVKLYFFLPLDIFSTNNITSTVPINIDASLTAESISPKENHVLNIAVLNVDTP